MTRLTPKFKTILALGGIALLGACTSLSNASRYGTTGAEYQYGYQGGAYGVGCLPQQVQGCGHSAHMGGVYYAPGYPVTNSYTTGTTTTTTTASVPPTISTPPVVSVPAEPVTCPAGTTPFGDGTCLQQDTPVYEPPTTYTPPPVTYQPPTIPYEPPTTYVPPVYLPPRK